MIACVRRKATPQDYVKSCWDAAWRLPWEDEIPFAMREADAQLSELIRFVQRDHRYALLVATRTEAGIVNLCIQDEAGPNAYHVPEGVLIAFGGDRRREVLNDKVSTIQIAPSILRNFGIAPPSYMADAIAA